MDSLAITDHGVMYGVIDFYRAAKEAGIKPVIGCEVYVAPGSRFDRENVNGEDRYYHLVLLAENDTGYHNLMKIVSKGFVDGFYYKPRVDMEVLETYHEGIIALSACLAGEIPRRLRNGEYDNAKAYALTRAAQAGVPAVVCSRKELGSQAAFEAAISQALADHGVELLVLAGFMSILSEDFTSRWPRRILNVHPSLIPSFCGKGYYGLKVHEAALAYGVKVTGATVHFVNEVPDGGEILLQKAVEVLPGDTPEVLQRRVMEQAEWILLPQATQMISEEIRREKDQ